jgi:hypothetical protein
MQSAESHRSDTNAIALRAEDRGRAVVRKHGVESGFAIPQRSVTGAKTKKRIFPGIRSFSRVITAKAGSRQAM